jgi:hypothetical protein
MASSAVEGHTSSQMDARVESNAYYLCMHPSAP